MRSPKRRASSPSAGRSGAPNVTFVRPGLGRFMPRPRIEPVPSRCTGTTGTPHRIDRKAAPPRNGWPQPSGERPPSGKISSDQPSSRSDGGQVGRAPVDPGAVDRDGAEGQRRQRAGDPGREEVVGGRRRRRAGDRHGRGIDVSISGASRWLGWLAAKMTGPRVLVVVDAARRSASRSSPTISGSATTFTEAAQRPGHDQRRAPPGPPACRAQSVSKSAPVLLLLRRHLDAPRHRRRPPREAPPGHDQAHPVRPPPRTAPHRPVDAIVPLTTVAHAPP